MSMKCWIYYSVHDSTVEPLLKGHPEIRTYGVNAGRSIRTKYLDDFIFSKACLYYITALMVNSSCTIAINRFTIYKTACKYIYYKTNVTECVIVVCSSYIARNQGHTKYCLGKDIATFNCTLLLMMIFIRHDNMHVACFVSILIK